MSSGLQRTDQLFGVLKASKTDVKRAFWTWDSDRPSTVGNMGVSFYEPEYTEVVVSRGGRVTVRVLLQRGGLQNTGPQA